MATEDLQGQTEANAVRNVRLIEELTEHAGANEDRADELEREAADLRSEAKRARSAAMALREVHEP